MNIQNVKHILFVCRGGVFRSRMAEAYTRSKDIQSLDIHSSGIDASIFPLHYISPFGKVALSEAGLLDYARQDRTVTTQDLLDRAQVIVFLDPTVAADAKERFQLKDQKIFTWDVKDIEDYGELDPTVEQKNDLARITLHHIQKLVDHLLLDIL